MKLIPYLIYLFILTFHDTILVNLISVYGVTVDISVLLVVLVALYKSEEETIWFAFFAGMVTGATDVAVMPYDILVMVIIGAVANLLAIRINLESLLSRLIILAGAVILHRIIVTAIISSNEFLFQFVRIILPIAGYTVIVGLIFFMIRDGRITWQKTKAIF